MTQTIVDQVLVRQSRAGVRPKFLIGGLLIVAAIIYLTVTAFQQSAQYFYPVDEIMSKGSEVVGKNLRASGAVVGSTIQ